MIVLTEIEAVRTAEAYITTWDLDGFIKKLKFPDNGFYFSFMRSTLTYTQLEAIYQNRERIAISDKYQVYAYTDNGNSDSRLIGRDAHGVYEYADSGNGLTDWAFTLDELPDLEDGLNLTGDDYYKELYGVGEQEYTLEELADKFNMKRDYTRE